MSMPEAAAELIAGAAEALESKWGFESESLARVCCASASSPVLFSYRSIISMGCCLSHVEKQQHCSSSCDSSGQARA